MILPTKHVSLSDSIIGLSGYILSFLKNNPCTIDSIWNKITNNENGDGACFLHHTIDNVLLAIDLLYMMGVVDINDDGGIFLV